MIDPQRKRRGPRFRNQGKCVVFVFFFFLALSALLPGLSEASPLSVAVVQSQDRYETGNNYPLRLRIRIAEPWYVHGTTKEGSLIPTVLSFQGKEGFSLEGVRFPLPEKKKFPYADQAIEVFSKEILVDLDLVVGADAPRGEQTIEGILSYQACSSSTCLPPDRAIFNIPLQIVPKGTEVRLINQDLFASESAQRGISGATSGWSSGTGFWLTLFGFFLGGLALNLTPCIYPLIPITVSYFTGEKSQSSISTLTRAALYLLGLAVTNSFLGVWAALSGRMVGSALQNPAVVLFLVFLFTALALSSFGLWEFRLPSFLTRHASRTFRGYFGTFFMGLTLGIIAAPCVGPFLLGLLTYVAQAGDPFFGFISFFVLSLGLGLPLAVLALFSGTVSRFPLSGDWMLWVRRLMGWVLLFMACYVAKPLIPSSFLEVTLLSAVVAAAGIHLGWIDRTGGRARRFAYFKKILGIILTAGAVFYFWTSAFQRTSVLWLSYDPAIISRAAQEGKPVILDFSAEWCQPCEIMEREVFQDAEVVELSRRFVAVRLDLTQRHPDQEKILGRYQVQGVPTIIFMNRDGQEEKDLRIEEIVDKPQFLKRMKALLNAPSSRPKETNAS